MGEGDRLVSEVAEVGPQLRRDAHELERLAGLEVGERDRRVAVRPEPLEQSLAAEDHKVAGGPLQRGHLAPRGLLNRGLLLRRGVVYGSGRLGLAFCGCRSGPGAARIPALLAAPAAAETLQ